MHHKKHLTSFHLNSVTECAVKRPSSPRLRPIRTNRVVLSSCPVSCSVAANSGDDTSTSGINLVGCFCLVTPGFRRFNCVYSRRRSVLLRLLYIRSLEGDTKRTASISARFCFAVIRYGVRTMLCRAGYTLGFTILHTRMRTCSVRGQFIPVKFRHRSVGLSVCLSVRVCPSVGNDRAVNYGKTAAY